MANPNAAQRDLAERLLHPLTSSPGGTDWIQLVLLGFDDGVRAACPALDVAGHCSLHATGKPGACRAVPLDAWRADEEQAAVLQIRAKEADSWGVDCIGSQAAPLFRPLTRGLRVVDSEAATALAERRRDLEHEKQTWGTEVFRALTGELFAKPERAAALPSDGFFVLSLVPVLLVLARSSRGPVLAYLAAQARLGAQLLARADAASAQQRQLRAFSETNARLHRALAEG